MRILVYKRTHTGDPGPTGCFGIYDCMGQVRDRDYDAVIGVGGIGDEAERHGIAGEINWIGIGPHKKYVDDKRGPEVTFDHFAYFGNEGPELKAKAPKLAKRMYDRNVRSVLDGLTAEEHAEALKIIVDAEDSPPSPALHPNEPNPEALARCKTKKKTRVRRKPPKPGKC